jgi:hypothetical protein
LKGTTLAIWIAALVAGCIIAATVVTACGVTPAEQARRIDANGNEIRYAASYVVNENYVRKMDELIAAIKENTEAIREAGQR